MTPAANRFKFIKICALAAFSILAAINIPYLLKDEESHSTPLLIPHQEYIAAAEAPAETQPPVISSEPEQPIETPAKTEIVETEEPKEIDETPPPIPQPPEPIEKPLRKHVIAKGETLSTISKKYYGTVKRWVEIYEKNRDVIKDKNNIKPGTVIVIP